GSTIQLESDKIMSRRIKLQTGDVVSTGSGNLKCKTIIHAVGPIWKNGTQNELYYLDLTVKNCLNYLDNNNYTSIAIPAISTGIFGLPIDLGTKHIVSTIKNYLDDKPNSIIKYICLIDQRKEVLRSFKIHLENIFTKAGKSPGELKKSWYYQIH
ncbi:hypothetical protein Ahia01_000188900, partial [Argonauta hians]